MLRWLHKQRTGEAFCSGETGAGRVDNREVINDVLVNLFNEILRLEEEAIITDKYKDISNNDMHIIEAVGLGRGEHVLHCSQA